MIKRLFKRLSLILVCALLFNVTYVLGAAKREASIQAVEGTVHIKKGGGEKRFKATKGMNLAEGDTVITGEDGAATLILDKDKMIKIAPNTTINIKDLKGIKGNEVTSINQPKGVTVTKIDDKLTGNSSYNQKTPTAIMGVKGTIFSTEQEGGQTNFTVVAGQTDVQLIGGPPLPASLLAGQQLSLWGPEMGIPAPLDLSRLTPFEVLVYSQHLESLPVQGVQQIQNYIQANPGILDAIMSGPTVINSQPQISYGQSSGSTSGGGGGSPSLPSPPSPPNPGNSDNPGEPEGPGDIGDTEDPETQIPLNYTSLSFSEYITGMATEEGLETLLLAVGILGGESRDGDFPITTTESHLHLGFSKKYSLNPLESITIPEEYFFLSSDYTLQFNEYLVGLSDKKNQWGAITRPIKLSTSNTISAKDALLKEFSAIEDFKMSAMLEIKVYFADQTTSSVITVEYNTDTPNQPHTQTIHFNQSIESVKIPFENMKSITVEGHSIYVSSLESIVDGLGNYPRTTGDTRCDFSVTAEMSLQNLTQEDKQIEALVNEYPGKYYNSFFYPDKLVEVLGFEMHLVRTRVSEESILESAHTFLLEQSSVFRPLATPDASSIQIDSLNRLDWEYDTNTSNYPVKNKIIYYFTPQVTYERSQ